MTKEKKPEVVVVRATSRASPDASVATTEAPPRASPVAAAPVTVLDGGAGVSGVEGWGVWGVTAAAPPPAPPPQAPSVRIAERNVASFISFTLCDPFFLFGIPTMAAFGNHLMKPN